LRVEGEAKDLLCSIKGQTAVLDERVLEEPRQTHGFPVHRSMPNKGKNTT
jgi:hypothetical protein